MDERWFEDCRVCGEYKPSCTCPTLDIFDDRFYEESRDDALPT